MINAGYIPGELVENGLISRKQLKLLLPVSAMTLWRWEREGRLPPHIVIGRTSFWRVKDIRAFLETA